ncbi:response regulator transcription factor [Pacificimonas sp. WHA3]|uniref:Response regulator transcription factor n=1 Tax=Pacificimonas pallii TaxID=2827236 RepID=A0ABS6SDW4_9SPHN|nr:response regulator transcription factor [Pacificimonas pallii]
MTKAQVLILDDDDAVLDALTLRLELEGYGIIASADPAAFMKTANVNESDCLLLDMRMPGTDGMAVLEHVRTRAPHLPVIMMTGHGDVELAVAALKAGAMDFLEKPFADRRLLDAIEKAVSARRSAQAASGADDAVHDRFGRLTPRETDVFHELIAGHPNKIIAHHLGCSQRTVEIHRSRVMTKMQAGNLADLVRMAVEGGLSGGK